MAAQVNIINECRAICISGRLNNSNANLWMKCQTLGENWVSFRTVLERRLILQSGESRH